MFSFFRCFSPRKLYRNSFGSFVISSTRDHQLFVRRYKEGMLEEATWCLSEVKIFDDLWIKSLYKKPIVTFPASSYIYMYNFSEVLLNISNFIAITIWAWLQVFLVIIIKAMALGCFNFLFIGAGLGNEKRIKINFRLK